MKYLIVFFSLIFSSVTFANAPAVSSPNSGSVATPITPCFVDGKYIGTYEITTCKDKGGTLYIR